MAVRRTSVPERIAGDILGFGTGEQVEESQSVLAKYFPELSLRLPAKGARGGRLGRAPQLAEQTIKYTPKEMIEALTPAPAAPAPAAPAPAAPTVTFPDYSSQIESLKQALTSQSELLKKLSENKQPTAAPTTATPPPTTPKVQTSEEQAKQTLTEIYRGVLGREPEEAGLKYWMGEGRAAGGITPEERSTLEQDFMRSPEYNIKKLYKEELGREPDEAGYKYWTTQDPRAGDNLITADEYGQLQQAFRQSEEYKKRQSGGTAGSSATGSSEYKPLMQVNDTDPNVIKSIFSSLRDSSDQQKYQQAVGSETVQEAYQQAFGRKADQPGLEYWSAQKAPGADTETVKQQLIASAKQAAPTSEDRVRIAYREALGREADEGGLKYWSQAGTAETDFEKFKSQLRVAAGLK